MKTGAVKFHILKTEPTDAGARLDAVRTDNTLVETFLSGASPDGIISALPGHKTTLRQIGAGVLARHKGPVADHSTDAQHCFAGRDVMLGMRSAENADNAADWLKYHVGLGATAALIFDRSPPDEARAFADALGDLLSKVGHDLPVVVVASDTPLGAPESPNIRNPRCAPVSAGDASEVTYSPWHSRLAEPILLEALRHRWLNSARTVTFLDICDLLLPPDRGIAWFDLVDQAAGRPIALEGREHYAWRLRAGQAHLCDHIFMRFGEKRWLTRWAVAPTKLAPGATWLPIRIDGTRAAPQRGRFIRAMGVAFGNAETAELVEKSDLVENAGVSQTLTRAFDKVPLRPRLPELPSDTGKTVVVTAMKNEGPFILDWIAHHLAIGVDHFLVYTNDSEDSTDRLLDALAGSGVVTRRDNPYRAMNSVPQHAAFRAAEAEASVQDAGWLMTLDVDEYVNIHKGQGRLDDLRAAVPEATVISMPWRLFGNGDVSQFVDQPVTEQFTHCARLYSPRPHQAWGFKTIYRNAGLFRRLGVHRPKGLVTRMRGHVRWVGGDGRPMPPEVWQNAWRMTEKTWGYDLVTLNHYALRSAESFLVKRERGRVNHTDRGQGTAYWFRMNHNADRDVTIGRHAENVAARKQSLLALPGVADAHEEAVEWHQKRVATLKSSPDFASLFAEITGPRLRRLSRMLDHFGSSVFHAGPGVIPEDVAFRDPGEDWTFTVPTTPRAD